MDAADKRMLEREALRNMIRQWNANRIDLFELSEPNNNLEFHGVMRFYFQDSGQKVATKCIRVASDATVTDVIEILIEKFRPDLRMLSIGSYSLWETHGPEDERRLEPHEKPLLVQLNWHADDREGRFLLKCTTSLEGSLTTVCEKGDQNFKRKLSKREKKELKKKEKLSRLKSDADDETRPVTEKIYTELPETSFTRSISNPEAVMRRRRQQKLERKLQQFRSKDGGPDTGGTLKIYGSSLSPDVPYKTLLLSVGDTAAGVLREMLDKYGLSRHDPHQYCIVQVNSADNSEYILEDEECPLAIVMTHPHRSSIMFHVRRRPADSQPRRRKKKAGGSSVSGGGSRASNEPVLLEVAPDGTPLENGRRIRVTDVLEVGSANGMALQLYGPSIQPRHCVIASADGGGSFAVTPLHADAHVMLNGQRVAHTARLQHGCLLKFGRVSTFRFVDPAQENMLNRNLSQSQHFGSGSIYDRSAGSDANANDDYQRTASPDHEAYYADNNNTLKLDNESLMMSPTGETKDEYSQDQDSRTNPQYKDNYETTFDLDGNVETKSICSAKSGGSGHDNRTAGARPGQEPILPAVLEFPEAGQAQFLAAVITHLDPHAPAFKLAPVYTLYLCARYRASTHYRPELSPNERAHKLTAFLHHVATLIHATVQERSADSAAQAFWMANASELLHFLKCDRHISSFSTQAQELLPTTVQSAFSHLVQCFQEELSPALVTLTRGAGADPDAVAPSLQVLAAAMVLLRRCRVNAALTIQLFSHLFHYINAVCFNKLVTGGAAAAGGAALPARLALLGAWAERQGLELAADCHLARVHQAVQLIQGVYRTPQEVRKALEYSCKLNSLQVRALLTPLATPDVVEAAVSHARALADELCRGEGREVAVEESSWLGVALLIPGDGFSAEVVRGVPPGLAEFVAPLQRGSLCRLAHQPHALGLWTVYMTGYGTTPTMQRPRRDIIQLHKNSNGMGLSIVAAKGAGQSKLGIYIKSVVPGGAAAADGRLAAGDQLLSVDGHSLVGITQEKAAEYLVRTGPTVTLEVAKQGAVLHGLATLLHQPGLNQQTRQDEGVVYEDRLRRNSGTFTNPHPALQRPTSPRLELATAGYGRRPCHAHCYNSTNESSSSSSDESEPCHPHYHGSIPRLIITLDRENNQLDEEQSPDTPACHHELKSARPIPVFAFTCEDYDSCDLVEPEPPPVPTLPAYDQFNECGEAFCLPPQMRPIDTKLTLDLFNNHNKEQELYRGRCTAADECASACDCCRSPQPDPSLIPYIDEPEPLIYENDYANKIVTPKIRRILPSMSLDKSEDSKPDTADAMCQTPSSSLVEDIDDDDKSSNKTAPLFSRNSLKLDINGEIKKVDEIKCRLKRTLFSISKSFSNKSEETDIPTYSTTESFPTSHSDDNNVKEPVGGAKNSAKQILDCIDRKSWKSPDEFRPSLGTVKALTKHFNSINLRYCVKSYKRNCQSSPNLSTLRGEKCIKDNMAVQSSVSLADLVYESNRTDTSDTKDTKLTDEEVKSFVIQLEDWSKYGSRGSEDTLAHGNEFELPNLPSEDTSENVIIFNEIVDKKPKIITLDNIKLKSSAVRETEGCSGDGSVVCGDNLPRVVNVLRRRNASSLSNISQDDGLALSMGGARRASERDLPARLAAEPVKPSKSTPALHHHLSQQSVSGGWGGRSRSTHNLSAPANQDGFYQNVTAINDRWSTLRSPTSTIMSSPQLQPQSPHQQQMLQQQTLNQQQQMIQQPFSHSQQMLQQQSPLQMQQQPSNQQHMLQQQQQMLQQQSPHPQQMLQQQHSAHSQQLLQQQPPNQQLLQQQPSHPQQLLQQQQPPHQQQLLQQQMPHQQQLIQQQPPHQLLPHQQQALRQQMPLQQQLQQQPPHQMLPQHAQNPPQNAYAHNQQMQQQRYDEWQQQHGAPSSPQKVQPPVAPKPQGVRRDLDNDDVHTPQPPQDNEDDWYMGAAGEVPGGPGGSPRGAPHNPWQREEREREAEARRAIGRARRDATIASLVALGPARAPHQNQQLRALQLERDFERRATLHDQEESTTEDQSPGSAPLSPAEGNPPPPKSILKSNARHDLTNGFTEQQAQVVIERERAPPESLSLAPPPPERGSSFAVMAARLPASPHASPHASPLTHRDKRVSFHAPAEPAETAAQPDDDHDHDQDDDDEDHTDEFLSEASSILAASPNTPTAAHTPGVIGAQEVYRDPRARRLAERQAAASAPAAVPETLSFREKMKMFALESGEHSTPRDKVKISRAQRDIDAVH